MVLETSKNVTHKPEEYICGTVPENENNHFCTATEFLKTGEYDLSSISHSMFVKQEGPDMKNYTSKDQTIFACRENHGLFCTGNYCNSKLKDFNVNNNCFKDMERRCSRFEPKKERMPEKLDDTWKENMNSEWRKCFHLTSERDYKNSSSPAQTCFYNSEALEPVLDDGDKESNMPDPIHICKITKPQTVDSVQEPVYLEEIVKFDKDGYCKTKNSDEELVVYCNSNLCNSKDKNYTEVTTECFPWHLWPEWRPEPLVKNQKFTQIKDMCLGVKDTRKASSEEMECLSGIIWPDDISHRGVCLAKEADEYECTDNQHDSSDETSTNTPTAQICILSRYYRYEKPTFLYDSRSYSMIFMYLEPKMTYFDQFAAEACREGNVVYCRGYQCNRNLETVFDEVGSCFNKTACHRFISDGINETRIRKIAGCPIWIMKNRMTCIQNAFRYGDKSTCAPTSNCFRNHVKENVISSDHHQACFCKNQENGEDLVLYLNVDDDYFLSYPEFDEQGYCLDHHSGDILCNFDFCNAPGVVNRTVKSCNLDHNTADEGGTPSPVVTMSYKDIIPYAMGVILFILAFGLMYKKIAKVLWKLYGLLMPSDSPQRVDESVYLIDRNQIRNNFGKKVRVDILKSISLPKNIFCLKHAEDNSESGNETFSYKLLMMEHSGGACADGFQHMQQLINLRNKVENEIIRYPRYFTRWHKITDKENIHHIKKILFEAKTTSSSTPSLESKFDSKFGFSTVDSLHQCACVFVSDKIEFENPVTLYQLINEAIDSGSPELSRLVCLNLIRGIVTHIDNYKSDQSDSTYDGLNSFFVKLDSERNRDVRPDINPTTILVDKTTINRCEPSIKIVMIAPKENNYYGSKNDISHARIYHHLGYSLNTKMNLFTYQINHMLGLILQLSVRNSVIISNHPFLQAHQKLRSKTYDSSDLGIHKESSGYGSRVHISNCTSDFEKTIDYFDHWLNGNKTDGLLDDDLYRLIHRCERGFPVNHIQQVQFAGEPRPNFLHGITDISPQDLLSQFNNRLWDERDAPFMFRDFLCYIENVIFQEKSKENL